MHGQIHLNRPLGEDTGVNADPLFKVFQSLLYWNDLMREHAGKRGVGVLTFRFNPCCIGMTL